MVCTTPMFRAVKEKYPKAKVLVIGNRVNKEILGGNTDVDGYLVYENSFWKLLKKIKNEKADFACDTNPNLVGLALCIWPEFRFYCLSSHRERFLVRLKRDYTKYLGSSLWLYTPYGQLRAKGIPASS